MPQLNHIDNPQKVNDLIKYIEEGFYLHDCFRMAGWAPSTFYRTYKKGEQAKRGKYREFYERIEKAKAQAHHDLYTVIYENATANRDSNDAKWLLSRRYPEIYAKTENQNVTGEQKIIIEYVGDND